MVKNFLYEINAQDSVQINTVLKVKEVPLHEFHIYSTMKYLSLCSAVYVAALHLLVSF